MPTPLYLPTSVSSPSVTMVVESAIGTDSLEHNAIEIANGRFVLVESNVLMRLDFTVDFMFPSLIASYSLPYGNLMSSNVLIWPDFKKFASF
ncbi:hypothetical protein L2E82_29773 [Cichorium intybus]|uniref:Uncharacterized protein n=1 Tax=Cichorium intybus TaxID=13427 RepID=A0ACB9CYJ6_CICIN|nr:hypothetical protein L2E82_29773 [Cichorium intybus]